MRESGYYPPGAEFDPNAPYNEKGIECSVCIGSGKLGTSADEHGIYEEECYNCDGKGCI